MNKFVRIIFYGNIFYGLCAVALCIESNLLQGFTINHFPFYLLIFFGTWIYYTMIYIRSSAANAGKEINDWYRLNLATFKTILFTILFVELLLLIYLVIIHYESLLELTLLQWSLLATVPVAGALYTFHPPVPFLTKFRQVGWLKPIIIGITWAGWVTIFPAIVWQLQYGNAEREELPDVYVWLINFLFITALAIIFDVKDYATDKLKALKTYPARLGIRKTYYYILLPISLATIATTLFFQLQQDFTFAQIIIQQIPFVVLLALALKPQHKEHVLYYLFFIDGLMMLKALSGIATIYFL